MNFVIPYYPILITFAIYTYNVDTLDTIFIPDYVLSCIETYLLILFVIAHRRSEEFNKTKKVLISCIAGIGLLSFIYFGPMSFVCLPDFKNCDLKLYITRMILLFIQLVLICMFPIKFPVAPSGSPNPPPYVEYTPV